MNAPLLDTHALVWRLEQSTEMPRRVHDYISEREGESDLLVATISLVEIAYLVERERVLPTLLQDVADAIANEQTALKLVDLNLEIAMQIPKVPREVIPEMPDRILAATAMVLQVPIVTRDRSIRAFTDIEAIW